MGLSMPAGAATIALDSFSSTTPLVRGQLKPYNLGSSDTEDSHWLVLDRQKRSLFVSPPRAGEGLIEPRDHPGPSDNSAADVASVATW